MLEASNDLDFGVDKQQDEPPEDDAHYPVCPVAALAPHQHGDHEHGQAGRQQHEDHVDAAAGEEAHQPDVLEAVVVGDYQQRNPAPGRRQHIEGNSRHRTRQVNQQVQCSIFCICR